jgi:predicted metal-dependent hydrolase
MPTNAPSVLVEARRSIPNGDNIVIRDVRIARHFVEFDVSVLEQGILDRIVIKALSTIADFDRYEMITEERLSKEDALDRSRLFNDERYWKCHEVLENIWKQSEGEEKRLLNGIILVAAAFVHFQKGENQTCLSILRRAHGKIELCTGEYYRINIDLLKDTVRKIIDTGTIISPTL